MPRSWPCTTSASGARRGFADALAAGDAVVADAAEVARRCDAVWVCTPTVGAPGAVDEALGRRARRVLREAARRGPGRAPRRWSRPSAAAGVPAQCGLVLRSAPVFRALRDLVQGGTLGAPMAAVFRDDQYFPIQGTYASQWRADVAQAGGGCLIEHSIHDVDILRFCFGEVDSVVGPDGQPRRPRGHRGPGRRHAVLRLGLRGAAHQRLARHPEPGLDPPARGLLPRGHGVAGRRVPGPAARADERRAPKSGPARRRRGWMRSRWPTTRSAWPCGPTSRPTGPSSTP